MEEGKSRERRENVAATIDPFRFYSTLWFGRRARQTLVSVDSTLGWSRVQGRKISCLCTACVELRETGGFGFRDPEIGRLYRISGTTSSVGTSWYATETVDRNVAGRLVRTGFCSSPVIKKLPIDSGLGRCALLNSE